MRIEYKGYAIESDPKNPRSYLIKNMNKGGSLPLAFDGWFTDSATAKRAIDGYVERSNAKTSAKG